ncbi:MAG: hypothetical protein VX490_05320, partial [Pseudomonadota bacterium]|nr:hypothetical protein [Pseudomonadota bacterium]
NGKRRPHDEIELLSTNKLPLPVGGFTVKSYLLLISIWCDLYLIDQTRDFLLMDLKAKIITKNKNDITRGAVKLISFCLVS